MDAARRRVLVEQRGWRRGTDEVPALPGLEAAVNADERVRMRYRSSRAETGEGMRTVDPYGLVSKGGTWYLVAAHRGAPRLYRVSRVREVHRTGRPARRPDERSPDEVWSVLRDRVESAPDAVTVTLRVDSAWRENVLRVVASQLAGPPVVLDGSRLELTFRAPGAARGVLLGFGDAVEVLAPEPLRAEMAGVAASVVALYG